HRRAALGAVEDQLLFRDGALENGAAQLVRRGCDVPGIFRKHVQLSSCFSRSAIMARSRALSSLPTRVTGKVSRASMRSGSLNFASPLSARNTPSSFTPGAWALRFGMMNAQPLSKKT